jgi:hypothetical protein
MNVLRVLPKRISVSLSSHVKHMSSTTMICNVSQQLAAKLRSELDYEKGILINIMCVTYRTYYYEQ